MIAAPNYARTVLRSFRYSECSQLIGVQFHVTSTETIRDEVATLGATVSPNATLLLEDIRNLYFQIAKFGILYLGYRVNRRDLDCEFRHGKQLLRDIGFDPESATRLNDFCPDFDWIMRDFASEVLEDKWYLLIHANIAEGSQFGPELVNSINTSNDLKKLPLPAMFTVTDACFTNSTSAWLARHFYL